MMVEVGRFSGRIEGSLLEFRRYPFRGLVRSVGAVVRYGHTLPIGVPGSFILVCGCRPAPKEIVSEWHFVLLSRSDMKMILNNGHFVFYTTK
jgi:hypothetical protein